MGVVATAGTTNAGLIDDLSGVAEVAGTGGLWFHVDGAYGAAAMFAPAARPLFDGIERADSFVVDPTSGCTPPSTAAALLYRRPRWPGPCTPRTPPTWRCCTGKAMMRRAFAIPATTPSTSRAEPEASPSGSLWWYGTDAYRRSMEKGLDTARRTADLVSVDVQPGAGPPARPLGGAVPPAGLEPPDYDAWSERLLTDQVAFVAQSSWGGEPVGRLAFLHPDTSLEMVEAVLASMA